LKTIYFELKQTKNPNQWTFQAKQRQTVGTNTHLKTAKNLQNDKNYINKTGIFAAYTRICFTKFKHIKMDLSLLHRK
jgi:hypothetical protein